MTLADVATSLVRWRHCSQLAKRQQRVARLQQERLCVVSLHSWQTPARKTLIVTDSIWLEMSLQRDRVLMLRSLPQDQTIGEGGKMKEAETILLPDPVFTCPTTPLHRCMGHHRLPVLGEDIHGDHPDPEYKAEAKSTKMITSSTQTA